MRPTRRRAHDWLFLSLGGFVLLAWGAVQLRSGEVFPPHGLVPGDSFYYARMARALPEVLNEGLDSYRLRRVGPSAVVHLAIQTLGLPAQRDDDVVEPFRIYNLVLLLGTLVLWVGIARAAPLSGAGMWLGGLLLFGNFASLKFPFYAPVLTDTTATALGALAVYGYLRCRPALSLLAVVSSAFVWPPLLLFGGLLVAFPRRELAEGEAPPRWPWVGGGLVAAGYVLGLVIEGTEWWVDAREGRGGVAAPWHSWLWLSVPVVTLWLAVAFRRLLENQDLFRPETYWKHLSGRGLLLMVAAVAAVGAVTRLLASGAAPPMTARLFLGFLFVQPVLRPAQSLVAHAAFFGLLPLVLLLRWPSACRAAHRLGLGMTLFTAALAVLGLVSESRQLLHGLAALALLAALSVEDLRFPRWAPCTLVALALFASKAWFPINSSEFGPKSPPASYPAQFFFMNIGPWMGDESYVLQGSLAVCAILVLTLVLAGSRPLLPGGAADVRSAHGLTLALAVAPWALVVSAWATEALARQVLDTRAERAFREPLTRPSRRLGWENVPLARGRVAGPGYDVRFDVNSDGLRGPDRPGREAGKRRIALLGGSFVEAFTVPEDRAAGAVLERLLVAGGCPADVVGVGVARYGTDQQRRLLASVAGRYQPDLVVLMFHHDDLRWALRDAVSGPLPDIESPLSPTSMPPNLRRPDEDLERWRGSAALRLFSELSFRTAPGTYASLGRLGVVDHDQPPLRLWPYVVREESMEAWRRTESLLRRLAADVRGAGATLAMCYLPADFEMDPAAWDTLLLRYRMSPQRWKPGRVFQRLETAAARLGVELIDPRNALLGTGRRAYLPGGGGLWSESGHERVALELRRPVERLLGCRVADEGGER